MEEGNDGSRDESKVVVDVFRTQHGVYELVHSHDGLGVLLNLNSDPSLLFPSILEANVQETGNEDQK